MSRGGVPKTEVGYRAVQREVLKMRRAQTIPYHWFRDGSRWRFRPDTHDSLSEALNDTARMYRRSLWRTERLKPEDHYYQQVKTDCAAPLLGAT
jgi:hypothetical protein